MEITSTPCDRIPRENACARPSLERRWSRPSTMLWAPEFFSSRYRPKPRPSCSANAGVSSVATSPRMSYSRKTCIGMVIGRSGPRSRGMYAAGAAPTTGPPRRRSEDGRERAHVPRLAPGQATLLARERGVAGVAVVVPDARPGLAGDRSERTARVGDEREDLATERPEVEDAARVDDGRSANAVDGGIDHRRRRLLIRVAPVLHP